MTKTLRELAHLTGAEIRNTPDADRIQITGVKPIGADAADFLTFVNAKSYVSQAKSSRAAAFLCNEEVAAELDRPVLVVKQVEVALARILNEFHPPAAPNGTISPACSH
jgi:UDP-3-O-[3-hydroxymyristoyl] glucosamine N-acyltransferase